MEGYEVDAMVDKPDEARVIYERLQTHPNALVSKKARQFMFEFQVTKQGLHKIM